MSATSEIIWIAVTGVCLLVATFLIWARFTSSWRGKDFWVWLPVFGKMDKWKKYDEQTGTAANRGEMLPVERELYSYYKSGLPEIKPDKFDNYVKYLSVAGQSDRIPMPVWMWFILYGLTVAEAFGTGALIAPLVSREITPNGALFIGAALAFVLAVVTLLFTHGAGEELYKNSIVSQIQTDYRQNSGFLLADGSHVQHINHISPTEVQDIDKGASPTTRMAARLNIATISAAKKKYMSIISAVLLVALAFVLSTWYRHDELNKHLDSEAVGMSSPSQASGSANYQNMFSSAGDGGASASSGNNTQLPAAVAQATQQSQKKAVNAIVSDKKSANDVGVLLLGVIYLFTQILGVVTGYKYGFFNEGVEKAYNETLGYQSYDSFLSHVVSPVAQVADLRMGMLRRSISNINATYHPEPFDFIEMYTRPAQYQAQRVAAQPALPVWSDEQLSDLAKELLSMPVEERAKYVKQKELTQEDFARLTKAIAVIKENQQQLPKDLLDALGD